MASPLSLLACAHRNAFVTCPHVSQKIMRFAFVVRLGLETRPSEGLFEGWIEEVDSRIERRFRSTEDLLLFLGQRFDAAVAGSTKRATPEETRPEERGAQRKRTKSRAPISKEGK